MATSIIQPNDTFTATLDVSKLQAKIAAVEVLLGYSTGLLPAASLALGADWNDDDRRCGLTPRR